MRHFFLFHFEPDLHIFVHPSSGFPYKEHLQIIRFPFHGLFYTPTRGVATFHLSLARLLATALIFCLVFYHILQLLDYCSRPHDICIPLFLYITIKVGHDMLSVEFQQT